MLSESRPEGRHSADTDAAGAQNQLRRMALFADWSDRDLELLSAATRRRLRPKGSLVLMQDEPGTVAFVILSGAVDVLLESTDGGEFRLARLGPGDHFGEMALLEPEPRSATVVAAEDSELLVLGREDFVARLLAHPPAMLRLLASLSRRLRRTDAQVGSFAFQGTAERLAQLLVLNARPERTRGSRVELSQTELASMVGATRQTVARLLGEWRREGYVRTGRGHTVVLQPDALAAMCGQTSLADESRR